MDGAVSYFVIIGFERVPEALAELTYGPTSRFVDTRHNSCKVYTVSSRLALVSCGLFKEA